MITVGGRRVRYLNCDLEEERRAINTSRFFSGLAIALTMLALLVSGDSLRDASDPRFATPP